MNTKQPIIIELNMQKMARDNIIWTIVLIIFTVLLNSLIHQRFTANFSLFDFFYLILAYIVLIILHEVFHLIGFMVFGGASYKELDYGVNLKLGVAYATTNKPLSNAAMKKALLLPLWTTGIVPTIAGFYVNSTVLLLAGAFLIAGAVGDIAMYKELRKYPKNALIQDDPQLPKLYVYAPQKKS